MSMLNAAQAAASDRLGGSTYWRDAMAPMMPDLPDFGALPDAAAMPTPAPQPAKPSQFDAERDEYAGLLRQRVVDENGMTKDGKMYRGPEARAFAAQNNGFDAVLKNEKLAQELARITIAENRRLGGFDPLPETSVQATDGETQQKAGNKSLSFDQASKLAAVEASYNQIQDLANSLFDPETGAFKRGDAVKAKLPGTPEARYNRKGEQALETWLRAMTGAAVTQSEMDRYVSMYLPQPWDDADVALDKLDRLEALYTGTLRNMGRGDSLNTDMSRVAATKKRRAAAQSARSAETPQRQPQAERPKLDSFWR